MIEFLVITFMVISLCVALTVTAAAALTVVALCVAAVAFGVTGAVRGVRRMLDELMRDEGGQP